MLKVEVRGSLIRLVYTRGQKEAEAIGHATDFPALLGLLVMQMVREKFEIDDICAALRQAMEKKIG